MPPIPTSRRAHGLPRFLICALLLALGLAGAYLLDALRLPQVYSIALLAATQAAALTAALVPLSAWLARRLGAMDEPRARGLSQQSVPRLGGLALLGGTVISLMLWLDTSQVWASVAVAALLISLVGALDDIRSQGLPPWAKLLGQLAAAGLLVATGVVVQDFTLPGLGRVELGGWSAPLTLLGLVGLMNVVNFSDGADGLAAGVCAIAAAAFAVIAFDLAQDAAATMAAIVAGAAAGFLIHNFHPASVFMGDCGSNLLGLLLGAVIVEGALKTNALLALVIPLLVLAVPLADTSFVIAKRIKYRRPVWRADSWHFHHRLASLGLGQRRIVLYLYGWTLAMAGLAVAMRFVPYSQPGGRINWGWAALLGFFCLVALAASLHLVYRLELTGRARRHANAQREAQRQRELALVTGEFEAVAPSPPASAAPSHPQRPPAAG